MKFSNVFYSDINLFTKEGKLFASSRPEIYKKALKSERIHPLAYEALKIDLASKFKHDRGSYVLSKTEFVKNTLKIIDEQSHEKN